MTRRKPTQRIDPEEGGDFPEEQRLRDGPMQEEIVEMAVEALNAQGYADLTVDTVNRNPVHRAAFVTLLRDCRPLPVILELIEDAEAGRL